MSPCAWPRGCFEDAPTGLCYYHGKVVDGLITADWYLMETTSGKPSASRRSRLGSVLSSAGASEVVVHAAVTTPMYPRHFSRHGSGFIRRGVLHVRV